MNQKLPKEKEKNLLQRAKNRTVHVLKSERGKTWTRRVLGGLVVAVGAIFFIAAVTYSTMAVYIFKDGLEAMETLPDDFLNKSDLIEHSEKLGEMVTQMLILCLAVFSWFMVVLSIGAINEQLEYERTEAIKKRDQKK